MPHPDAMLTCPSHFSCSGLTALAASLTTRSWGDHGCDVWSCASGSLVANRRPSCCDFLPLTPPYLGHVLVRTHLPRPFAGHDIHSEDRRRSPRDRQGWLAWTQHKRQRLYVTGSNGICEIQKHDQFRARETKDNICARRTCAQIRVGAAILHKRCKYVSHKSSRKALTKICIVNYGPQDRSQGSASRQQCL